MRLTKRDMLKRLGVAGLFATFPSIAGCSAVASRRVYPGAPSNLKSLTTMAVPISASERQTRIEKAQRLLQDFGFGALLLESGSALTYFTGISWWRSERFTGALITADGDFSIITPAFEEPSIREQMEFGEDVRTWDEHESPFALVAGYLAEKNLLTKSLAVEGTVRHFITAGIQLERPSLRLVSGRAITRGCRMFKSETEIALMQAATNVTMAAYRHVYPNVVVGMTPGDISGLMNAVTQAFGGEVDFSLVLLGDASAYPHGTGKPQQLSDGDVVLMDCGCSVHGYKSDISRSWVVGEPSSKHRKVWRTVKAGQELALETMAIGTAAGRVDDVVRAFYAGEGYSPGYAAPGLTHRLGHGIGMDGHEPVNFVHGEQTKLAAGMCFSNEPGIYIPGEFGIRLEDCLHMSARGPVLFSALSPSIDDPFGVL